MEIGVWTPKTVASKTLPLEEVRILPIGDIHYGEHGCDVERLQRHLQWGLDQHCYFIGLGDYMDTASPSNRRIMGLASVDLYDSLRDMTDEAADKTLGELKAILEPTRGRWLGLVSGHHMWQFQDGSTSDTRLAQFLDTRYMGDGAAMTVLHFKMPAAKSGDHHAYLRIWYTHGAGAAQTPGAILNRLERVAKTFFAHIYLMGHLHVKLMERIPWIDITATAGDRVRWNSTNRILAVTGGFLKGYEMGRTNAFGYPAAGYVEKKMYAPTSLGGLTLYARPYFKDGYVKIDTDASVG
jgi:hypothetical protein